MDDWREADWPDLTRRLMAYTAFLFDQCDLEVDERAIQRLIEQALVDFLDEHHTPASRRSVFTTIAAMIRVRVTQQAKRKRKRT